MKLAVKADPIEQIEAHLTQAVALAERISGRPELLDRVELIEFTDLLGATAGLLQHIRRTALGGRDDPDDELPEDATPPGPPPAPIRVLPVPAPVITAVVPAPPKPRAVPPPVPPASNSMDDDLIERWRQHLAAAGYAQTTQRLRVSHLVRLAGGLPGLLSLTTGDLAGFMAQFRETNGPASLKTLQSSLRSFYTWSQSARLTAANPTDGLLKVRVPHAVGRIATDRQVETGLTIATPRERAMILLGREAGLRREEIASLRIADLEGDSLRVRGKGGKVRRIPVGDQLREALLAVRPSLGEYFFPGVKGGHVHVDTIERAIKVTVGVNPHALRHAAATAAYSRTRDVQAVAAFLGHSSIATTQSYLHLHESQMQALAAAVALKN